VPARVDGYGSAIELATCRHPVAVADRFDQVEMSGVDLRLC
jgi:hypothetical protein